MGTYVGTPAKKSFYKYPGAPFIVGRSKVLRSTTAGVVAITTGLRSPAYAVATLHASTIGLGTNGSTRAGCPLASHNLKFFAVSGSYVKFKVFATSQLNQTQITPVALVQSYVSFDFWIFEDSVQRA